MTVSRDPATGDIQISCNTCGKLAPPAREIMAAHGLNRMGWHCMGGTHYCPDHKETKDG